MVFVLYVGHCHFLFLKYVYPLVHQQFAMENHHFQWVNPLCLWPCSIAMLNYQRVLFLFTFVYIWYSDLTPASKFSPQGSLSLHGCGTKRFPPQRPDEGPARVNGCQRSHWCGKKVMCCGALRIMSNGLGLSMVEPWQLHKGRLGQGPGGQAARTGAILSLFSACAHPVPDEHHSLAQLGIW